MIENDKARLASLEEKYENYDNDDLAEKERFVAFALEHAENLQRLFIKLPKPRLLQCKQMLFPAGFWIDGNRKVYTPEMSILTRLASNIKDLPNPEKSFMVAFYNQVRTEFGRKTPPNELMSHTMGLCLP